MPEPLNELERSILDFLVGYLREHTYQPSIREIGRRFGIRSTKTVSEYLQSLADKGWIERDPSRSRGVRLIGVNLRPDIVSVPVYGGVSPSGAPLDPARVLESIDIDRKAAGGHGRFFMVMEGDGMAADGIRDGDLLLAESADEGAVENGDLVLARQGSELVVKRLYRRGGEVVLEPASADFAPTLVRRGSDVLVFGRVAGVFRRLRKHLTLSPANVPEEEADLGA